MSPPIGVCHKCCESGGCICREIEPVVTEHDLALEEVWTNCKSLCANRDDALLILARLSKRLVAGSKVYGALNLKKDVRDFMLEFQDEVYDALFYSEVIRKRAE